MRFHKLIASVLGIGYVDKGGGTLAALFCCILCFILPNGNFNYYINVMATVITLVLGVWSGNVMDDVWGKDSKKVVIDEVAGMLVTLLFIPPEIKYLVTGLLLFRFFDIAKPLFIRRLEKLPGGWGVMADDVLAGIYAHILLWLVVKYKLF